MSALDEKSIYRSVHKPCRIWMHIFTKYWSWRWVCYSLLECYPNVPYTKVSESISVLSRCVYLVRLKCTKFNFGWVSAQASLGELPVPPDSQLATWWREGRGKGSVVLFEQGLCTVLSFMAQINAWQIFCRVLVALKTLVTAGENNGYYRLLASAWLNGTTLCPQKKTKATEFLSASLYVSKRGAYWDRLCRDVVGWLVGCHARALWPNGAS